MLWQLSVGIVVCSLNSLMTKLILVSISSFSSQVSSKYMHSNILFNSLQNVVVSSLFIAFLTFLTKGSFSISVSLLAAFGSLFSPCVGEVDRGHKRADYAVTYPSKGNKFE